MTSGVSQTLLNKGYITLEQLEQAKQRQQTEGGPLAAHLITLGAVSEKDFAQIAGKEGGVPIIQLEKYRISESVSQLIPQQLAAKHLSIPLVQKDEKLLVAMLDPSDVEALNDLKFATGLSIKAVPALHSSILSYQNNMCSPRATTTEQPQTTSAPRMSSRPPNEMYYSHSGAVTLPGIILMGINGFISAYIIAYLYSIGIFWIPWVYLNFLLTLLCGFGVGVAVAYGAIWGKTRNTLVVFCFGLAAGVLAEYRAWITWIDMSTEYGQVRSLEQVFAIMSEITEEGQWQVFGWMPTGGEIITIWSIEALVIIGGTAALAAGILISRPYCERCKRWITDPYVIEKLTPVSNSAQLLVQLEDGDFSPLTSLTRVAPSSRTYTRMEMLRCPSCRLFQMLTIKDIEISTDDEGNDVQSEQYIIENLLINGEVYAWIKDNIGGAFNAM